ncbi:MAG TPA: HU family DNA-binding protein [Thermoanaerobaculia bacterium]|nr:HU family DNA-binding protein [Thermoanaerobaculia bacterium]HUM29707.1 HU family DNA-binding protein [Thermoanaerobaculia bacterium]HXK67007.1 HU family DNA-binding protein [Thermoanaerobaculia bacterium]
MTRKEIVNTIVDRLGLPRNQTKKAVDTIFEGMKHALLRGERIEIRGFGVFQVNTRQPKVGWNLNTGEKVEVPEGKTVKFKPGKQLRELA